MTDLAINDEITQFIVQFLLGEGNEALAECVSYGLPLQRSVHIFPSRFFQKDTYLTAKSLPGLPLKQVGGTPLLFGEPVTCETEHVITTHADIIASTFFLITRYEEYVRPNVRDAHGRFIGTESLLYRAGVLDRPIVEEYGKLLRLWLRKTGISVKEPKPCFSRIYLTHDVDIPWTTFTLSHAFKHCLSRLIKQRKLELYPFANRFGCIRWDPQYKFDDLIQADKKVKEAISVYFIKSGGRYAPYDAPTYVDTKHFEKLCDKLHSSGAMLGYHVSYDAGVNTELIDGEITKLNEHLEGKVSFSRNHYLASREPADYYRLIQNGITDDFSMAYADVAGFRLGTCRTVNWIDPLTMRITELRLHPLTIMDCTLTSYMGLGEESSHRYGENLIKQTYLHGGEIDLLWHNNEGSGDKNNLDWRNYLHFVNYLRELPFEGESENSHEK